MELRWLLSAVVKSEGGLDGVVGGMMVIELLAGTMRLERDGIAAAEDDMRQTYTDPFYTIENRLRRDKVI